MGYIFSLRTLLAVLAVSASTLTAAVMFTGAPTASIYVVPDRTTVEAGDEVTLHVMVKSNVPVNAFTSELIFSTDHFQVSDISYNNSVADLWVEEPWYNRADNSIYFAGGTTKPDGFIGTGELMRVTLQTKRAGDTALTLHNTRVLAHDGLGGDVPLSQPLDTLFVIDTTPFATPLQTIAIKPIAIVPSLPRLDVNNDGALNFKDIGVLLMNLGSNKAEYDFNGDGAVTWSDIRTWQQLRKQVSE